MAPSSHQPLTSPAKQRKKPKPSIPIDSIEQLKDKPKTPEQLQKEAKTKQESEDRAREQKKKEKPKPLSVEQAVINFTKLPEKLLEALLQPQQNYTDLNSPEVQQKMEQDELAEVRKRLKVLQDEISDAKQSLEEKEMKRKQEQDEEEKKKAEEEAQRKQAAMEAEQPATKQKRGMLGKKKPKKTIENKASQGKQ